MSDYLATTDIVRQRYSTGAPGSELSRYSDAREAAERAFDRWLANERAEAYDEGYAASGQPTPVGELPAEYGHDNPHRDENTP